MPARMSRGAGKLHTGSKAWRAVRQRVLERDEFRCQLRLPGFTGTATEADHIVPREVGGALYDEGNLRASCGSCNRSRGNRLRRKRTPPSQEWPKSKSEGGDSNAGPVIV